MMLVGASQSALAQVPCTIVANRVVQNGGAPCTVGGVTVSGTAITAINSANVTANGSVTATGFGTGISSNTNSLVTANGPVTADGLGLSASSGGRIVANNIVLSNGGGGGARAMLADNATITANGITVNWGSGGSPGVVEAQNGGLIEFTAPSTINNSAGGVPFLLGATNPGSRIIANGLTMSAGSSGGIIGARAQDGGNIQLTGGGITFSGGGGNTGLSATGTDSAITANGVAIAINNGGGNDVGANAASAGKVTLTGGTISVPGAGGGERGLRAVGAGSTVTASNVAVSVTGSGGNAGLNAVNSGAITTTGGSVSVVNGAGGLLQNGGSATMTGTNVAASGNGGIGFQFNNGGVPNTLQYSNGTISASDASFSVAGGTTANINLASTTAIANNNTLLTTSGTTTFNAQASTLQGVISTNSGSSTVNLTQGTVWTMTGNSTTTNLTNNNSQIIYTGPTGDPTQLASYKTLTTRNYTGINGTIGLNTFLGTDGSPSDRLVINGGTATGNSLLKITNTTGPGAQTVANGIPVVLAMNGGTTAPGAFALVGEVRGGAFDYFLFRGGLNGSSPNDWFLRSSFVVGPIEPPIEPPTRPSIPLVPLVPALPIDPAPDPLPPGVFPIIGPEIATYGVVQPIARQLGMTTLGTLHERTGDTSLIATMGAPCLAGGDTGNGIVRKAPAKAPDCLNAGWSPSAWGRVIGQQIDNHYRAFADPRASGQLLGFQSGIDLWRGEWLPGHRDAAGIYFAYANANVDVTGRVTNEAATNYVLRRTGGLNLDAWSGAAYWTHYGPGDWYLDAVAQATRYQGAATTQFAGLATTGFGFVSSLEAGYPIQLPMFGPGFVLEPQAQVVWQRVSFDDANDGLGEIALGTTSGASGRIGLRGKWTIVNDSGQVWQPYVRANLWRDWGAQATAIYSGVDLVPLAQQANRLQLGGGVSVKMNTNVSLYANADYQLSIGDTEGGKRDGIRGAAGVRFMW